MSREHNSRWEANQHSMTTFSVRWSPDDPSVPDEAMHMGADQHYDAAPIGPVDYNYTTDTHGLLIGEGGAD